MKASSAFRFSWVARPRRARPWCRPQATPTGKYLGTAHLQRLLREPPSALVSGICENDTGALLPDMPIDEVTFHEVGAFDSRPGGDVAVQTLLSNQRDEAAKRGCDGLIWNWTPETATLHATCLVYRDSGPGPAPMLKTNGPL